MRDLSTLLTREIVAPLNRMGIAIDLRQIQAVLVLTPILLVVAAFLYTGWKKRQRMRDAGM